MKTLILGGARSGKSAYAEQQALESGQPVTVIATARADDAEMAARIAHHQARRPKEWATAEAPIALGAAIRQHAQADRVVLIDCLTVWLANLLFSEAHDFPETGLITPPALFEQELASLLAAIDEAPGTVYLVSNEVGLGIVPLGAVNRWFVDEAGRLNQAIAQRCQRAVFIAAGLPLQLKG